MKMLSVAALLSGISLSSAMAYTGQELAPQATVGPAQARQAALAAYPGTERDMELERENGGSGLRYSFTIAGAQGRHEVGIDAANARVLENAAEGANPD